LGCIGGEMKSKNTIMGKLQWHLLPWRELADVVRVFMHGNTKYEPDSWKSVENKKEVYFDAVMRHLSEWWEGKDPDESGLSHLAHAAACILILLWDKNNKKEK
jgi:hypothetical protein